MNLLDKAFMRGEWNIAIRPIDKNIDLPHDELFTPLDCKRNKWFADPFLFTNNGKTYCFIEEMNIMTNRGAISVCEIHDGKFGEIKKVIAEPFHMSFPNVFRYNDCIYMIPETSEVNQIRLYKSVDFPMKWELYSVLVEGMDAVDTTVTIEDGRLFLFTYLDKEKISKVFEVTNNLHMATEINNVVIANYRPGGNSLIINNERLRILQDCEEAYGKRMFVYKEHGKIGDKTYRSELYTTIEAGKLHIVGVNNPYCTHTITRSDRYEIVDYVSTRFRLLKIPYLLIHKLQQMKKR